MRISTETGRLYVSILQAALRQQPAIGLPKVNMMSTLHGIRNARASERIYLFHRKARIPESLHNFLSYLETIETDAWANNRMNIGRNGSKTGGHFPNSLCRDSKHSSTPSGMNGADGRAHRVVEKHGDTVGRARTDGNARHVGHQGIDALQIFASERWRINVCNPIAVNLMGLDNRKGKFCPALRGKGRHSQPKIII